MWRDLVSGELRENVKELDKVGNSCLPIDSAEIFWVQSINGWHKLGTGERATDVCMYRCTDRSMEVWQAETTDFNPPTNQLTDQQADLRGHREVSLPIALLINRWIYCCCGKRRYLPLTDTLCKSRILPGLFLCVSKCFHYPRNQSSMCKHLWILIHQLVLNTGKPEKIITSFPGQFFFRPKLKTNLEEKAKYKTMQGRHRLILRGGRRCIHYRKDEIIHGLSPSVKCVSPLFRDMSLDKIWNAG